MQVINLERSIVVTGDEFTNVACDQEGATGGGRGGGGGARGCQCDPSRGLTKCTVGLHMVGANSGLLQVEYTRVERCGQRGIKGRYCLHFHQLQQCQDCLLRGNAIETGQQRAIVVHGTHRSQVEFNVAYDIRGAGYYIEDGNEMYNTLQYNVVICPHAFRGPLGGCTIPGTDNREADTSMNQAGIWAIGVRNNFIGNRASNSFNGLLLHPGFMKHGQGLAENTVCTTHLPFGRIAGNTCHGHGRFGWYTISFVYPRNVVQQLSNNGATDSETCGWANCDGRDTGYQVPVVDMVDYHNVWTGHYEQGDLQVIALHAC